MPKCVTLPQMEIIVDCMYHNYCKDKTDQKSLVKMADHCGVSTNTFLKIRRILEAMKLIFVEGERARQKCYWNTSKSSPNPMMTTEIYRAYTKDVKSKIKINLKPKETRLPSKELALQALAKNGCVSVVLKYVSGNKTVIETYTY